MCGTSIHLAKHKSNQEDQLPRLPIYNAI